MVVNIAGNATHGARSTDHIVASTPNIAGAANTANIAGAANTADTELHPNMDHTPVPVSRGYPRQANPAV
jgi:hypothetical protein